MNNEKISIIVPIYNVDNYLPKCIDSILAQTYTTFELLLINDGSPDKAGAICDEYAEKDNRIRVFHILNGGVAKARQFGFDNSTGEYIVFVDPDDWLPLNSIELLYSNMADDIDMVVGSYSYHKLHKTGYAKYKPTVYGGEEYLKRLIASKIAKSPWARIYRRSIFSAESFPVRKTGQDYLMNIEVCTRVRNVKLINEIVYCYLHRDNSAFRSVNYSFDYQIGLSVMIREILTKNLDFALYKTAYAKSVLCSLKSLLPYRIAIDLNNPIVAEMLEILKHEKMTFKEAIQKMALQYPLVREIVYWSYKVRYKQFRN